MACLSSKVLYLVYIGFIVRFGFPTMASVLNNCYICIHISHTKFNNHGIDSSYIAFHVSKIRHKTIFYVGPHIHRYTYGVVTKTPQHFRFGMPQASRIDHDTPIWGAVGKMRPGGEWPLKLHMLYLLSQPWMIRIFSGWARTGWHITGRSFCLTLLRKEGQPWKSAFNIVFYLDPSTHLWEIYNHLSYKTAHPDICTCYWCNIEMFATF